MSDTLYTILEPGWVWTILWVVITPLALAVCNRLGWIPSEQSDARHLGGTARISQDNPVERKS